MLDADKPSDGPDDTFVYDPNKPVPSYGGGLCCVTLGSYFGSGAQDQSVIELRDDVLVYTSAPLTKDLAAIGPVSVKFWAKSSARDTDFTAKLVDVHPERVRARTCSTAWSARASAKGSKKAPSLIEPGKAYQYQIDLGYAGSVFKKGPPRSASTSPRRTSRTCARNHNTGDDPATDTATKVATQTILHNAQQPAYLELSVAPDVRIWPR